MMYEFETSINYEGEDRAVMVRYDYEPATGLGISEPRIPAQIWIERVTDIASGAELDVCSDQVLDLAWEHYRNG